MILAIPKGRIFEQAIAVLDAMGISLPSTPTRKIMHKTSEHDLQVVVLRSHDVLTYVSQGTVDMGIVGKDLIEEYQPERCLEMVDLGIAACSIVCASLPDATLDGERLRVATKYTNTTRSYFHDQGKHVDIVPLRGGMELAPNLGIADCIVDIVDTGKTLQENGLIVVDTISHITSRLIINHPRYIFHFPAINRFIERLEAVL